MKSALHLHRALEHLDKAGRIAEHQQLRIARLETELDDEQQRHAENEIALAAQSKRLRAAIFAAIDEIKRGNTSQALGLLREAVSE